MSKRVTHAFEELLTIPTYPLGPANVNPIIGTKRHEKPYPYPMYDCLTDERILEEYRGLVLENEYLKVTVLPKLGAKLYSALDKRNGKQIFYLNNVVKPQLIGMTGAWSSGGVEFNFPRAHRPSCMEELDAFCRENEDGTASIMLGEVDRSTGLSFSVELKLHPEKAYIEQIMHVHNPTPVPQRFYVWNTSSYPETRDMEVRYPIKWHLDEANRKRTPWPYKGDVDLRWGNQYHQMTGLFGTRVEEDFFGVYDDELGIGTVHVADHMESPGKKIWIWGDADLGVMWNKVLTEEDGPYIEYQAGNVQSQNAFTWLAPYQRHSWKEFWFQAIDTGPYTYACKEAIVSVKVGESETSDQLKLALRLHCNETYKGAKLVVLHDSHVLFEAAGDWSPKAPGQWDLSIPTIAFTDGILRMRLYDQDEELIVDYMIRSNDSISDQVNGKPEIQQDDDVKTLMFRLSQCESRMLYGEALKLVNELLATNPDYMEAYFRKAVVQIKMLDLQGAESTLMHALHLNHQSQEGHYYVGLILFLLNEHRQGRPYLLEVNDTSAFAPQACILLGKMALLDQDYAKARQYFEKASKVFERSDTSEVLLTYTLWKQGCMNKAETVLDQLLHEHPLDCIARAQQWLQTPIVNRKSISWSNIHELLHVVQFYSELGDQESQIVLLEQYSHKDERNPLVLYHLGRLNSLQGRVDLAIQLYKDAEACSMDLVFPTLGLTLDALEDAIVKLGEGAILARYYAGLIYYSVERADEADRLWRECAEANMSTSLVYRNLGMSLVRSGQLEEAISVLEQGLGKLPYNTDIVLELNRLYRAKGFTEKRLALLETVTETLIDEKLARVLISIYNDTHQFEKSVQLLTELSYRAWEIEENPDLELKRLYSQTWLGKAIAEMGESKWEEALVSLESAMTYTLNTQMARSYEQCDIRIWLLIAICHEKQGRLSKALHYYNRISSMPQHRNAPDYVDYIKGTQKKVELEWLGVREIDN